MAFNLLIFAASALRALWFFIPNAYLEPSYIPLPLMAFSRSDWKGVLVSQMLLSAGNVALYGSFIIIACYWSHILRCSQNDPDSPVDEQERQRKPKSSTLQQFVRIIVVLVLLELANFGLFLSRNYNSEKMALFDSSIFALASLVLAKYMVDLGRKMYEAILFTDSISQSTSLAQAQRIRGMMTVSAAFFLFRAIIEYGFGIPLLWRCSGKSESKRKQGG